MARRQTRFARKAKNYIWTAVRVDLNADLGATPLQANIVQASDWTAAPGFRRGTLMAVRGWLCAGAGVFTNIARDSRALIAKEAAEAPVGSLDPNLVTTYVNEDVLWTGGYNSVSGSTGPVFFDVHVKTKRKITVDDEIRIVVSEALAGAPNGVSWTGILRGLINLNNA